MDNTKEFCDELPGADECETGFDETAVSADPYFEYDQKRASCSFTGHRVISSVDKAELLPRLKSTVLYLVSLGVRDFHCGGALGFDTLAASVVYDISREHPGVRLIPELPYENQADNWEDKDKRIYEFIKSKADEINVHSKKPKSKEEAIKALFLRNRIMIDKSHYCVCYLKSEKAVRGGTAYTVNYAKLHDLQIINLADGNTAINAHG